MLRVYYLAGRLDYCIDVKLLHRIFDLLIHFVRIPFAFLQISCLASRYLLVGNLPSIHHIPGSYLPVLTALDHANPRAFGFSLSLVVSQGSDDDPHKA